jgi:ferredoxin
MPVRVSVDRSLCEGIALCESLSPDHFQVADNGDLALVRPDVTDDEVAMVESAVRACPNAALSLGEAGEDR